MRRVSKIAALVATMVIHFASAVALAQTAQSVTRGDSYLVAYFLDEEPSDLGQAILPTAARDVAVARVSLIGRPRYLVRREPEEDALPPEYLYRSRLSVVRVLSGHAAVGTNFDVTFAKPNRSGRMTMVPLSREEINRNYFVIAYVDEDGQRHLAGYPISEAKYRGWEAAAMEFVRPPWLPKH